MLHHRARKSSVGINSYEKKMPGSRLRARPRLFCVRMFVSRTKICRGRAFGHGPGFSALGCSSRAAECDGDDGLERVGEAVDDHAQLASWLSASSRQRESSSSSLLSLLAAQPARHGRD